MTFISLYDLLFSNFMNCVDMNNWINYMTIKLSIKFEQMVDATQRLEKPSGCLRPFGLKNSMFYETFSVWFQQSDETFFTWFSRMKKHLCSIFLS